MGVKVVSLGTPVMDVSPGTAVMGGTRVESLDRLATLVTMITGTVAQRAETRTRGNLHTAEMIMTDTTAVVVLLKNITEGRMNPTGTHTEIPGTDAVSQRSP